jgi:hypothetical protein
MKSEYVGFKNSIITVWWKNYGNLMQKPREIYATDLLRNDWQQTAASGIVLQQSKLRWVENCSSAAAVGSCPIQSLIRIFEGRNS